MKSDKRIVRLAFVLGFSFGLFIVTVFGAVIMRTVTAADSLTVEVDNYGDALEVVAYNPDFDFTRTVENMQYQIDGGIWRDIVPDDGAYGDPWVLGYVNPYDYPGGQHDITVRALDNYGEWWPVGYITETLDNPENIEVYYFTEGGPGPDEMVVMEAGSMWGALSVAGIEYKIDDGDWTWLPADDGAYDSDYETASFPLNTVPIGMHDIYMRASDVFGQYYPLPDGYSQDFIEGTGTAIGGSPGNPAPITEAGTIYNFTDNSSGDPDYYIYLYATVPEAGNYTFEIYDVGDPVTFTFVEYYGTDDSYTFPVEEGLQTLTYDFTAAGAETHYFRIFGQNPRPNPGDFGARLVGQGEELPVNSSSIIPRLNNNDPVILPVTPSGDRRLVAVHVAYRSNDYEVVSVESNLDGEFSKACSTNRNEYVSEMWYLANPQSSFAEVTVTWDGSVDDIIASIAAIEGINLADPIYDYACQNGWDTAPNVTVSSDDDNLIIGGVTIYSGGNTLSMGSGTTEVTNHTFSNVIASMAGKTGSAPESTLNWSSGVSWPWATAAIAINMLPDDDPTPPEISFSQSPGANIGGSTTITGTAFDDIGTIISVDVDYMTGGYWYNEEAAADDGTFDELSEDFSVNIDGLVTGSYEMNVNVESNYGLTNTYSFSGDVEADAPELEVVNLGLTPMQDTTPYYTGTASDTGGNVVAVDYLVFDPAIPPDGLELDWTPATADDGAFDEPTEPFHFEVAQELIDGVKFIRIRATDSFGNVTMDNDKVGYLVDKIIIDAVDTSVPVVQVQDVIPNPTRNPKPPLQGTIRDSDEELSSPLTSMFYRVDGNSWIELPAYDGDTDEVEEFFSIELEGLGLGSHQVDVRAVDSSGNDTDSTGENGSITFEIIEQEELNSTNLTKEETFETHDDQDLIATDLIWGNGILRLKEEMNPVGTPLITTNFMPRYRTVANHIEMTESATGGFWVSKIGGYFSYYDTGTNTEYEYHMTDFVSWDTIARRIREVYVGGEYHVWIAAEYGVIGINFGSSITDGVGDSAIEVPSGFLATNMVMVDDRNGADYGLWFNHNTGVTYYKPNDFSNPGDDQMMVYTNADGYNIDNTTGMYLDPDTGYVWYADYIDGISVVGDNNTPLNKADDQYASFPTYSNVFDFGKDKNGKIFFGGNRGLEMQLDDGGTPFDPSDDTFIMLADINDLGVDVVANIKYHPGVYPVGSQFFVSTRSGDVKYVSINDTYEDPLDDQIITLPLSSNQYPNTVAHIQMLDYDTLRVAITSLGVYEFELNRDFVASGYALSEVDAQIEGRLGVDFITLEDVEIINPSGGIAYEVSNDGGITWVPISLGDTVNFEGNDYRIKFKIILTRGSTPVLGSYRLTYSAYVDPDDRELNLDIDDEPSEVRTGEEFSFTVKAFDELANPYDEDTPVTLELRKVTDNSVVSSFNVTNTIVEAGQSLIDNARAEVLGMHYIYGWSDSATAISDPINFVGDDVIPIPTLTLTADKYIVTEGETVTLSWSSTYLDTRTLVSETENFGEVAASGSMQVVINEDTTFTISGTGLYGSLSRSATITVEGEDDEEEGLPPEIVVFDIESEISDDDRDKVTISWRVLHVDEVDIIGVGSNLPPEGSADVFITESTDFTIIAENDYGRATETKRVEFRRGVVEIPETGEEGQPSILVALSPLLLSGGMLFVLALLPVTGFQGVISYISGFFTRLGFLIGIVIKRKKKYWGIVFDEAESKPIPFAIVRIYQDGSVVAQTVSDTHGRYGLSLEEGGSYQLEALANGFDKYTKEVALNRVGENVEVVEDIPMKREPKKLDAVRKFIFYSRQKMLRWMRFILVVMMIVGFVYTAYVTIQYPVLINFLMIFIYMFLFQINIIMYLRSIKGAVGHVLDKDTNEGLPGVSMRVYHDEKQIGVFLTNDNGVVKINLDSGKYLMLMNKNGYAAVEETEATAFEDMQEGFSELEIKGGYITRDYYMRKSAERKEMRTETPFGK